jgi:peroxiredoxin
MAVRVQSLVLKGRPIQTLREGDSVPAVTLLSLDGRPVTLAYGIGRNTILYYFSPDCPWSRRNSDNISALATATAGQFRFISYTPLTLKMEKYRQTNKAPEPILTDSDQPLRGLYKLTGTPQTLVISANGKVLRNWEGAYTGNLKTEIEKYFRVTLPGLSKELKPF